MSRPRIILLFMAGVATLGALIALLVGWQALKVNESLQRTVEDATDLRTALESADQPQIEEELAALQQSSTEASDRTNSWQWAVLTALPAIGDDATGVRVVSEVIDDLSENGLEPLAQTATELDELLPKEGRVDPASVEKLQDPVGRAAEALADAERRLSAEDSTGYVERFRVKFRELQSQVKTAAKATDAASVAVDVLPSMLGQDGPKDFLLVFQNNAEIRPTGGLPGVVSVVSTNDGNISLGRQVSVGTFGERPTPLPITREEEEVFGEQLGTFLQDANFTPDWPRAAELIRSRWEEDYPEDIDGVLTVDTVAMSYVLGAIGPIEVGDYTLTSDNVVDVLLNRVYLEVEDSAAQDAFFQQVAATVFNRISSGEVPEPRSLMRALVRAGDEGRAYVNLTDGADQRALLGRRVAGATLNEEGRADAIDVTLNDGTGSKMSYFLRSQVRGNVVSCLDGRMQVKVDARLVSEAPEDAASLPDVITGGGRYGVDSGKQLVAVGLFTPSDGRITEFSIQDKKYEGFGSIGDRAVSTAFLLLEPGKPQDVSWVLDVPRIEGEMVLRVTPGIEPEDTSSRLASVC